MEFFSEEHKAQVIELIENAKDDDEARDIYEELGTKEDVTSIRNGNGLRACV